MCPIFEGSVLTDFEKYEKITWLPVMWTYRTIQFWVPIMKMFYPEILYSLLAGPALLFIYYIAPYCAAVL